MRSDIRSREGSLRERRSVVGGLMAFSVSKGVCNRLREICCTGVTVGGKRTERLKFSGDGPTMEGRLSCLHSRNCVRRVSVSGLFRSRGLTRIIGLAPAKR